MEREEIMSKMKNIIIDKLCVDESEIKSESSFKEDLDADSLDVVELIVEFEKEFNVEISDDDIDEIKTVKDAIEYIFERQK